MFICLINKLTKMYISYVSVSRERKEYIQYRFNVGLYKIIVLNEWNI